MDALKAVCSETKWKLVQSLSKKDKTATELAEQFNTSISNITQQLSDLESVKIVKKVGTKKGATRPFAKYSLDRGFILLVEAMPKEARKLFMEVDENLKMHLRIWSIPQKEFHYFVEKFWWDMQDCMESVKSVAVFGSVAKGEARPDSDIDVIVLADETAKEELEKRFSAKIVGPKGSGKMIMSQVFAPDEFENSLKSGSKFAKEVLDSMIVIYDKNSVLLDLGESYGKY